MPDGSEVRDLHGVKNDEREATHPNVFRRAMQNAAIGMCLVTPEGVIFEVNAALCSMWGRDAEELARTRWQDITHADDLGADEALVAKVLAGTINSYRIQKRYLRPDGSIIWGDLSVSSVRDASGQVEFFISQVVDVTDSVASLNVLAEAEASYRFLLGNVSDMMLRSDSEAVTEWILPSVADVLEELSDADGQPSGESTPGVVGQRFRLMAETSTDVVVLSGMDRVARWISPSIRRNLGWKPEELIGTAISDLVHPDDWAETEPVRAKLYSGERVGENQSYVVRMRTKAGAYRWVSTHAAPLFNEFGLALGVVSGIRDVHEIVVARQEAEADRARLQATLDSQLDPSVLLEAVRDDDGRIVDFIFTDANDAACEYNERTREELVGSRLLDLLPGQAGSGMLNLYAEAVESGAPLILDDFPYPHEIIGSERRFDIRAIRVGDALSFTWRDVTDRHRAVEELRASEEQFRLLAQNSSDVVIRRVGEEIIWVSPSLIDTLGWHPKEWIGRNGLDFVHPEERDTASQLAEAVESGEDHIIRLRMRAKGGDYHWCDVRAHPYRDATGQIDGSVASLRTVDAEVASERELKRRAQYDGLTGILSRKEAFNRISALFGHDPRLGGKVAVMFCDVDDFKSINDSLGHAAGDHVLATVAERISTTVRETDIVGRIGGDEILVVLIGVHDIDEARNVGEKVRRAVARPLTTPGHAVLDATVSIGVTLVHEDDTVDSAVARADKAMYQAKQSGMNRVETI